MNLSSRIKEFIQYKGLSVRAFEEKIGCSIGVINRCISKNTDLTVANLMKIINAYPEINHSWLLTGDGSMIFSFKDCFTEEDLNQTDHFKENIHHKQETCTEVKKGIPIIPIEAMAGEFKGETNIMDYDCEFYSIPGLSKADYLIRVSGVSMCPTYNNGDIVACKRIINIQDAFFQWGRVYIIDTDQGPIMKRIKPGHDKEHVLIVSDNPDYEPFELHCSQIYHIALVLGCIKLE